MTNNSQNKRVVMIFQWIIFIMDLLFLKKILPKYDIVYLAPPALRWATKTWDSSSRFFLPRRWVPRRFFKNFNARLSLETRNNSMHLRSYGAKPAISRTMLRMNLLWVVLRYSKHEEKERLAIKDRNKWKNPTKIYKNKQLTPLRATVRDL